MRPLSHEYAPFYAGYVDQVPEEAVLPVLRRQLDEVLQFWRSIPEAMAGTIQAPYSWTVRQVIQHLADGERVFGYRLLRFARGDQTPLPGFDEHLYANATEEHPVPIADSIEEFEGLRRANLALIRGLGDETCEETWSRTGIASNASMSVRALAYILAGHVRHHDRILRERLKGHTSQPS